jgi:nucleoside-diphosphate-sugar epimerase
VISDAAFRRDFGWEPQVDIKETLRSAVATARLQDPR